MEILIYGDTWLLKLDESAKGSNMECGERRVEDRLFGKVHIYREDGGRKKEA